MEAAEGCMSREMVSSRPRRTITHLLEVLSPFLELHGIPIHPICVDAATGRGGLGELHHFNMTSRAAVVVVVVVVEVGGGGGPVAFNNTSPVNLLSPSSLGADGGMVCVIQ